MKLLKFIIPAIFAVLLLAYFVIVLPTPKSQAFISYAPGQQDTCGHLTASTSETIGNGTPNGDFFTIGDAYKTTAKITSNANISNVTVTWKTHWCDNASEKLSGGACNNNEHTIPFTANFIAGSSQSFDSDTRSSKEQGFSGMCGLFQNDLTFNYVLNGVSCHSAFSNGTGNGNASWTYTYLWDGQHLTSTNPWTPDWQCHMATITPTNSPTPTVTPTVSPTMSPTMSPTTSPTTTPTTTPTTSVSPTESIIPTITATLTPTPTGTNSNNCGNNNQSGNNDNNNCNQSNSSSSSSSSGGSSSSTSTVNVGGITITNNNSNSQTQTQNNTQSQSQTGQVLGASTTTTLPKTGTPLTLWSILGLIPMGLIIRKFATKA